jgi:dCMP deaminase
VIPGKRLCIVIFTYIGDDHDSEVMYRIAIAKAALKILTSHWKTSTIVFPITLPEELQVFRKRNYFMLLGFDAPVKIRYANYCKKHGRPKNAILDFVQLDDKTRFGTHEYPSHIQDCLLNAERIIQNKGSIEDLYLQLRCKKYLAIDVLNPEHARPTWDLYFIRLAEMAAWRSNCCMYRAGSLVVKGYSVVSTGYNGTPYNTPNCFEGGCESCARNEEAGDCFCLHSESNAILEAGVMNCKGSTLYSTHFPCIACAKSLVQAGIVRLVFSKEETFNSVVDGFLRSAGLEIVHKTPSVAGNAV